MEDKDKNDTFLDSDILNVIRDISFLKESYIKSCSDRKELEKQVDRLNKELRDARESAKVHISDLAESKQLITEQQTTIAKLAAVKSDIKRYKDEITLREKQINSLEQEKIEYHKHFKMDQGYLEEGLNMKINNMKHEHSEEVKNLQNELNILTSEMVCRARRLEEEKLQLCEEKDEMINRLVLEYEEKLQRAHAQYTCLKDETRSMVERYKNKIETLEQKNLPRTNVVPPSVVRRAEGPLPGPFRLLPKGGARPLQPPPTPPPPPEHKSLKRKLFSRNVDEFQESQ